MLNKTRAIVLHHVRYGESSLIVTLYTEKFGRIACMVNNVKTKKPRFASTLFQPLTILETDFYYRHTREVQRLKEASPDIIYNSIPYSHHKNAIAMFLSEVLFLSLREEESNPVLFSFIYHSLQLLDASDKITPWFHHWFMIRLTQYLGFFPFDEFGGENNILPDSRLFSMLSPQASNGLVAIIQNPQGPPDLSGMHHRERNELLEWIIRFYNLHIDDFSRMKSWAILQEVFRQ
jgi:DNA repair protein RecO (recombination protein O)